ncbi:DUF5989 family protein [Candidatus Seongchinamella marina]|uniref:DUF5989 family protein n=1 Tax=Candidatus Seongchinamella marina TaxID=2518990 RepID=UPI00311AB3A4
MNSNSSRRNGILNRGLAILGASSLILELIKDLWAFLKQRKKLWLAPIILILLVLGMLIVLTQGSAIAPFIYTLF